MEDTASASQDLEFMAAVEVPPPLAAAPDPDDVLDRVWGDIHQMRQDWEAQGPVQGDAFTVLVVDWG
eukprot:11024171-Heterocapsa_arctica.AAC.1